MVHQAEMLTDWGRVTLLTQGSVVLEPDVLAKAVHERLSALAHPGGDRR